MAGPANHGPRHIMNGLIFLDLNFPARLELPFHGMSGLTVLHAVKDNGENIVLRVQPVRSRIITPAFKAALRIRFL